jgi:hypothetical protein
VLDSEEDELDSGLDELDSVDVAGVWVSVVAVVFTVSTGVVAVSELVASADLACSVVVWVRVGSVSVVCVVVDDDAACGAREAALRAFVEPVEVVTRFAARSPLVEDFPFVSAPFVAALALLPGKACAASSVKAPVSVAEPASSQRLQRARRRSAASRERLDGDGSMRTYSTPQPSIH